MKEKRTNPEILEELNFYKKYFRIYKIAFIILAIFLMFFMILSFSIINHVSKDCDEEVMDILLFEIDYMDYVHNKYDLNMSKELKDFLRFKMEELIAE